MSMWYPRDISCVLCESCFTDHANHEVYTIRPVTPCKICGVTYSDANPTHYFTRDPRPLKLSLHVKLLLNLEIPVDTLDCSRGERVAIDAAISHMIRDRGWKLLSQEQID